MKATILLLAALCVVFAQPPSYIQPPYTHHAILDNNQVLAATGPFAGPASSSSACGAGLVSLSRSTGMLSYFLSNNVAGTTAAHIHGPANPGDSAGVIVVLAGFSSGSNNAANGSVSLSGMAGFNTSWYDWFDNGLMYFNIHTTAYPSGEIKGQILATGQQMTVMNSAQEGDSTDSSPSLGLAFTMFNPNNNMISGFIFHNVSGATAAHLHGPAALGSTAGVIYGFTPFASPIIFSTTLTAAQAVSLNQGMLYYNVHTTNFPNGEIRGQINPIINYLADLDGQQDNQITTSAGVGMAAFWPNVNLWSSMYHTVPTGNITAAHIHQGALGVSGPPKYFYNTTMVNPITQAFPIDNTLPAFSTSPSAYYFNIHTTGAPNGIIRGQIQPKTTSGSSPAGSTTTTNGGTMSGTPTNAPATTASPVSTTSSASSVFASVALVFAAVVVLF